MAESEDNPAPYVGKIHTLALARMAELGLNANQLAARCKGVNRASIYNFCNGSPNRVDRAVRLDTLAAILDGLDLDIVPRKGGRK